MIVAVIVGRGLAFLSSAVLPRGVVRAGQGRIGRTPTRWLASSAIAASRQPHRRYRADGRADRPTGAGGAATGGRAAQRVRPTLNGVPSFTTVRAAGAA